MRYPQLPVSCLDDGLIECGDYDNWAEACWRIKSTPRDRETLDELLASIGEIGLEEPLWIEVQNCNHRLFLADGHHRAVALIELGITEFPYRWRWRFPRWRGQRIPQPGAGDPLPEHLLERIKEGI